MFLPLVALPLTVLLMACGKGGDGAGTAAVLPTLVEAVVAANDTVALTVRSVGSLEADAQVEMRAEAEGRVARILFEEGQSVTRGQPLLILDQAKLRAELEAAEATETRTRAEMVNLGRQVGRNRGLLANGAISQQAFDDLQTRYEAAEARRAEAVATVSLARERLGDATVRAPFSGRVGERVVDLGDFLKRGDSLLMVVDDDSLEIGFSVPERYIGRLTRGSPVTLRVQSYPDRIFAGSVTFVSPVVDPTNRTVRIKARVPNVQGELRAGQFANVILGLERRADAVVVPEAAIVPQEGKAFVFLVRDGIAHQREVRIGERNPGLVEILSGVQVGDTVVVAGQQKIRDGSPVAPTVEPLERKTEPSSAELVDGASVGRPAGAGGRADPADTTGA